MNTDRLLSAVACGGREIFAALLFVVLWSSSAAGQVSGSGVLAGSIADPSGRAVGGALIRITSETTAFTRTLESDHHGYYIAPLLPPGDYTVTVTEAHFAPLVTRQVHVGVSETEALDVRLSTVADTQQVSVSSSELGQESAAAGTVTSHELVTNLPLSSRNYSQIIGLNPGVGGEVADAGALGRGDTSYSAGPTGFSANGAATNDNNFQMNGADVNDIEGGAFISRGVPVPSPDAIEEFRVSTQPYDASFGRNSGANVNLVTRSGTSSVHGSAFEYLRNDALNANTYFRNATGQGRGVLKQNQVGGTLSGPVLTPRVLAFLAYQETRQSNGIDITCADSLSLPPLTNDRSAAGIGAVFAGQRGYFQNAFGGVGPAIAPDGSNISSVALAVLQRKNADGSYLIPTPQVIVSATGNFDARGLATISLPCHYTEHQGNVNADWQPTQRSRLSLRSFAANSSESETLPTALLGGSTLPGAPYHITDRFRSGTITHTYVFNSNLLSQFEFGFNRVAANDTQAYPFTFSSVGATVPTFDNAVPQLEIASVTTGGEGEAFTGAITTFSLQDTLTYTRGRNFIHLGGGMVRNQENQPEVQFRAAAVFLQFSDFLLGQDAAQNGTAAVCAFYGCGAGYSDIAYAGDLAGQSQREYRILSGNTYMQDNLRLTAHLTLNFGLRYERLGDFSDRLGHNVSFFPSLADPNPPATGSVQGYVVQANYPGAVPAGITRLHNNYALDGDGQNTWQPRAGLSWRMLSDRAVLHAGYGLFRSRLTGDPYNQSSVSPPFTLLRQYQGTDPVSASLSLAQPLPPVTVSLPAFTPYCPPTAPSCNLNPQVYVGFAADAEPPYYQHYSSDVQTALTSTLTFDVGYAGSRGTHLVTETFPNQAGLASPSNPIRGVTTNTLANLPFRVPVAGFTTNNLGIIATSGSSWYNALQSSLHKQTTRSGELLVSYTWARLLADSYGGTDAQHGGTLLGNQLQHSISYGPDSFLREQRIVVSYLLNLPSPRRGVLRAALGNFHVSGVTTAQSGHRLSVTYQNQFSVYGVKNDRAELVEGCNPGLSGSAESRLTNFFNTACFSTPPVIGDDHIATSFGNSPLGLITGPRQVNVDGALVRSIALPALHEGSSLNLRAEAYNLFNHPQFQDPDTELTSATFGQVRSTTGNSRIVQLALKLRF
jgi:hypothetical protein